jgi:hypothetical protein
MAARLRRAVRGVRGARGRAAERAAGHRADADRERAHRRRRARTGLVGTQAQPVISRGRADGGGRHSGVPLPDLAGGPRPWRGARPATPHRVRGAPARRQRRGTCPRRAARGRMPPGDLAGRGGGTRRRLLGGRDDGVHSCHWPRPGRGHDVLDDLRRDRRRDREHPAHADRLPGRPAADHAAAHLGGGPGGERRRWGRPPRRGAASGPGQRRRRGSGGGYHQRRPGVLGPVHSRPAGPRPLSRRSLSRRSLSRRSLSRRSLSRCSRRPCSPPGSARCRRRSAGGACSPGPGRRGRRRLSGDNRPRQCRSRPGCWSCRASRAAR